MKKSESEMEKSTISRQNPQSGTGTKKGWYRYPLDRGKVIPIPIKVAQVLIHQKRNGTGTNQCGTGTDASSSPDFCTLALLSPNSYTDSIGTLIND